MSIIQVQAIRNSSMLSRSIGITQSLLIRNKSGINGFFGTVAGSPTWLEFYPKV
jgi:hypothetical protein